MMHGSKRRRRVSAPSAWLALVLLFVGTHYCPLAALAAAAGGRAPLCHGVVEERAAALNGCCHSPASGAAERAPAGAEREPCCAQYAAPGKVHVEKHPSADGAPALAGAAAAPAPTPSAARRRGPRDDRAEQLPLAPSRPPLGSRAPPLS